MLSFLFLIAATSAVQAHAQDWRIVGSSERFMLAVEMSNVRTTGPVKRFWSAIAYDEPQDEAETSLGLQEVDCDERKYRILQATFYREDGSVVMGGAGGENMHEPWSYIVPGTGNEASANAICDGVIADMEGFPSHREFVDFAQSYYASR